MPCLSLNELCLTLGDYPAMNSSFCAGVIKKKTRSCPHLLCQKASIIYDALVLHKVGLQKIFSVGTLQKEEICFVVMFKGIILQGKSGKQPQWSALAALE